MYKQLAAIYHRLSHLGIVKALGQCYLQGTPLGSLVAYLRLRKQRNHRRKPEYPIKVVFIQQHKVNWDIVKALYEAMVEDPRFSPQLVTLDEPNDPTPNAAYLNLVELYGSDSVIQAYTDDELFDLESLYPDYVLLPRPYDQYLPRRYRSFSIAKYASVVFIPYGFSLFKNVEKDAFNGRFFRNVSIMFADSAYIAQMQRDRYPISHRDKTRVALVTGLPYYAQFLDIENHSIEQRRMSVLWTPRWGEEKELGGSSFLKYKDSVFAYIDDNPDCNLILRPHPLMFGHLLSVGRITQLEMDEILKRVETAPNMSFDNSASLLDCFAAADVLMTDISSIIIPFLLTGKPIVYCETGAILNEIGERLREAFYVANSFEEAQAHLESIRNGHDPLKEKRSEFISSELFASGDDPASVIMNCLSNDFKGYSG